MKTGTDRKYTLGAVVLIVMGLYMLNANFFLIPGLAGWGNE